MFWIFPNLDKYSYRWSPLEQHHKFYKKITDSHHTKHHARCSMSFTFRHLHQCSICTRVILLLTSKMSHLFFPNPTHKTEIGRRILIATDLHKSNNLANQKQVLSFALPFASLSIVYKKNGGLYNQFAEPNWHVLTFLHPKFFTLNPKP